jgi:hypothetical protein
MGKRFSRMMRLKTVILATEGDMENILEIDFEKRNPA